MEFTSGLALINSYSDEDEDESETSNLNNEDLSIAYSRETISTVTLPNGSVNRLPLPSSIVQLFKNNPVVNSAPPDDPTLHDGRVRSFPHQRGNWSTYVYVPYTPGEGFYNVVLSLRLSVAECGVQLKAVEGFHISLTRTVVLLHHWIDAFVNSVKTKLSCFPSFTAELTTPEVYCNEERTRTFLGLRVMMGSKHLCDMAQGLDECLAEFRLPPFYKDPSFHMSVLWVVGDHEERLRALLPQLHADLNILFTSHPYLLRFDVTQCLCKTGNKMFTFPLFS